MVELVVLNTRLSGTWINHPHHLLYQLCWLKGTGSYTITVGGSGGGAGGGGIQIRSSKIWN